MKEGRKEGGRKKGRNEGIKEESQGSLRNKEG